MVLGARGYLAPERLDGDDDKPSCDVYSLGIMLYELLTGRHVVLSVHKDYHADALDKHLRALDWPGVAPEAAEEVRALVADLCRYEESARPRYDQILERLDRLLDGSQLAPDLPGWSRSRVLPLFRDRPRLRPIDHPAYRDLAFVERTGKGLSHPAPPDVDEEVRAFLKLPDWASRLEDLELLLDRQPHWTEAPFLEILPNGPRAWWQFWGKDLPNDQLVAVLKCLRSRPSPAVRERVAYLKQHADPAVAAAAADVR
jgi:serine/threonine protein kinase